MTLVRILLVLVIVTGVAVGWCSQMSDTNQRMAVYQVYAADKGEVDRATALGEAQRALDVSLSLNGAITYASLGIIILAGTCLARLKRPTEA